MENPRLTFVSPTILAGDRSLTSIAAHELAHSWSGNLVTNATWEHFWINEGLTTYIENRVMEALYGRERAMLLEHIERQGLLAELRTLPPADTALYISLEGRDPDETSSVPYAKGQAFLRMLEVSLGRDRFDTWLRGFFERHAFSSLTTEGFREDLRTHALEGDEAREEGLQLKEWLYGPGLPTNVSVPAPAVLKQVDAEVTRFTNGTPASSLAVSGWSPQEWQHFLGALPLALSDTQVADLDATFRLSRTGNSAVLFDWLRIVVRHHYRPALPALERFLTSMGRTRFVLPLFEDLVKTDWGRATARTIYARARPLYHSSSRTAVEAVLKMPGE